MQGVLYMQVCGESLYELRESFYELHGLEGFSFEEDLDNN